MVVATEPGFAPPLASMTPPAIPSKFQIIAASLVLVCHLYGPNVIFAVSSGGGFGGKKESGQLRFGGRERPFRAPICIPYDDLEKLGIPPPPEGRYMSRYQVPSPSRRKRSSVDREEVTHRSMEREVNMRKSNPVDEEDRFHKRAMDQDYHVSKRSSDESNQRHRSRSSRDRELEKKVLTEGPPIGKQACTKAVLLTRRTVHSKGAPLRLKNSIPVGVLWTGKNAHTKGALGIGMSVLTSGTSPVTTRGLLVMIASS
ncbi:hypothetical protein M0R45_001367 [Rubus argutus]|uniref:Uncharacterized protein n=1 Tax=Rubus argutus TaxID=59490 RepID=A0AAW1VKU5_RUBAR